MELPDIIDRLRKIPGSEVGVGAQEDEIVAAERTLGAQFPRQYREFLGTLGWARIPIYEFYGLGRDVPQALELVGRTMLEREEMHPHLPKYLIPVVNDGGGNHHCLDLPRSKGEDATIVFWDHDRPEDQDPDETYPNFVSMLEECVQAAEDFVKDDLS